MNALINAYPVIAIAVVAFLTVAAIRYSGLELAKGHQRDVRVVWYLFSAWLLFTTVILFWCRNVGAIDAHGAFQGQRGATINWLLGRMLDLGDEVDIFGTAVGVVLVPQLLSGFLSGIFGCGTAPILVGRALSFFVWAVVKSFVGAAGIIFSFALYGYLASWQGWIFKAAGSMACLSLLLLMLTFAFLYAYRCGPEALSANKSPLLLKVLPWLEAVAVFFTRNMPKKAGRGRFFCSIVFGYSAEADADGKADQAANQTAGPDTKSPPNGPG